MPKGLTMRGFRQVGSRGLVLLAALLVAAPLAARQGQGADPAINQPYLDPDYRQWVERFESSGREVYDRRAAIVAASGVKAGMRVADIGAGTGLFTREFARAVGPSGRAYAVDISKTFVDNILRTAREQGLGNVTGIVNTQNDTGLSPASIDLAFVCDTYHHFEQPRAMLDSIRRALKPGGTLVVIDFERIEGKSSGWVLGHVRAGREQAIREIEAAGFRFAGAEDILAENFYLRFTRGADPPKPKQ
jgi:ubiquinone/menaquinone biosynthesis C-methylase UbiE